MEPEIINADWPAPDNIVAFTTTRKGGVSDKPFADFNLAEHVGDKPADVRINRQRLQAQFCLPNQPTWLNQVHSKRVIVIDRHNSALESADGLITFKKGIVCAVMTADCMPLFLCNRAGTKVGVVHAGWMGMANGVIEQSVENLQESPENIFAWAGPTIGLDNFEIGAEVRQQLGGSDRLYKYSSNPDKFFADLYQLAGERLAAIGVRSYGHSNVCTYADESRFFSYRRDQSTGRMASIIYMC